MGGRGPSSWVSRDLSTRHEAASGRPIGSGGEYRFFSADLSRAVLQPIGAYEPSLSPEASEQTPFLRADFPAADPTAFCAGSCYDPLVTGAEGFANVPPETAFGKGCEGHIVCGPVFQGASPDAGHVVLSSVVPLVEGAPAGVSFSGLDSLYEWSAGRLQLISVRPGGAGPAPVSAEPTLGSVQSPRNAISADGSRVIWSEATGNQHLYLRDTAREETLQLDTKQGGSGKGQTKPVFQTAAADDSRIFFTDSQQLTAGASESGADLYECKIVESEAGELTCALTDLTPQPGPGEGAEVLGSVIGASEDGSSVYFVAKGVLAHNKVDNGSGEEKAEPGTCGLGFTVPQAQQTCNLYLSHEGATAFIATLSGEDLQDWSEVLAGMTARVSPDGRWLAFMSQRPLTGYDNRDALSGERDQEVYLYHAAAGDGEATLVCASCNPSGARPHGVRVLDTTSSPIVSKNLSFNGLVAANVPGWTRETDGSGFGHQPRYLSDGGRLFFNSSDALVPQDSNGTEDVYQYEPPTGSEAPPNDACTAESATYGAASGGCVGLISSGASGGESAFLDASESGEDVFFLTSAQLSHRDTDSALDVYDARVDGGEPEPAKPVECEGDACQSPVQAPDDPTPGSLTFSGPGNLITPLVPGPKKTTKTVKCAKGKHLAHGKCVKTKAKKKKAKKAKRAGNNRRARS